MTIQEEFRLLQEDETFASLKQAYTSNPVLTRGWEKCMKTGRMPIRGFSEQEVEYLRRLMRIMTDRAEDLGCYSSAAYWRGQCTDETEMNLPRSKWVNEFMNGK